MIFIQRVKGTRTDMERIAHGATRGEKNGRQRWRMPVMLFLLTLLCLPGSSIAAGLRAGTMAPEFELADLDGNSHDLAELRKDSHVLLLFWSVNCHFCHKLIPEFKQLYDRYHGRGVELVAVNVGYESLHDVQHYAKDNELPYLILNDDERKEEIIEAYGLIGTPTFVLVAPDGRIRSVSYQIPALPAPPPAPPGDGAAEAPDAGEGEE